MWNELAWAPEYPLSTYEMSHIFYLTTIRLIGGWEGRPKIGGRKKGGFTGFPGIGIWGSYYWLGKKFILTPWFGILFPGLGLLKNGFGRHSKEGRERFHGLKL